MSSCVEPGAEALRTAPVPRSAPLASDGSFRHLYQTHFDGVMSFILRFGIASQDAEDLAQRVFMVAYRKSAGSQPLEQPGVWLRAVALRVIHEHLRWWRVRRTASWLVEQTWAGRSDNDLNPEREALASESLQRIRTVLFRMSGKLRDALVLLDIEGISPHEAAELLGVPHNTVRSRHHLAREEFKRLWDRLPQRRELTNE